MEMKGTRDGTVTLYITDEPTCCTRDGPPSPLHANAGTFTPKCGLFCRCWVCNVSVGVLDVSGVAGVMERDSLGNNLNISDIIEVIQMDPDFQDGEPLYGGGGGGTNMEDARKRSAHVKILEQPASKALRFRYECEGRSAGSIPGVNSTPENKTFPSIQVRLLS
uniref:RHD domain-containing protein n=1 Tax=Timema shepardi TaxID=629360 RepID=A0A7R9G043_TIMSH|nr:unnamed protein product [Timema shepardi]